MSRPVTPSLACDTIIELIDYPDRPIVLIERVNPPYGWAIPGGFVDVGETVEHAAIREAREEVSLNVKLITLLGLYSDPKRDNRGHTVTAVYVAEANGNPVAADDAKNCQIFSIDSFPRVLAFDHEQVLIDYVDFRTTGKVAPLRYIANR
ncbi:NUDIX hydrolase [Nitrosomonas sp.]|uniref:NUDIX hydrolase n=1 Tax=Nitrosomonas sp. TaxID=42353 RepID=UPI00262E30A1|nr:NUDIX hydrolase [Nitrosomonas sp.]MCW5602156.1 NUDIX hydrolase [Nitrosomonas sp.]